MGWATRHICAQEFFNGACKNFGGLGGFALPPLFAYTKSWSGFPSSTFFVLFLLTALCAGWMHWTVVKMLHRESPQLAGRIEQPASPNPIPREPEEANR